MQNLWDEKEASAAGKSDLELRVYTSRLLGREPSLVLHGGGNTSVKIDEQNLFGESEHLLYVKGSGWDLATIESAGFSPVRMDTLLKMARLPQLDDTSMVRVQKAAMTNSSAPAPSVEAILHALIPFKFVDHTHADAMVAISNTPDGEATIRQIYGDRVLYIPYVMPGFILARKVFELTQDVDWNKYDGMVLMHHGLFTFGQTARQSYERMIQYASKAEDYLKAKNAFEQSSDGAPQAPEDLRRFAYLRREVSKLAGSPMVAQIAMSPKALTFSRLANIKEICSRGPLTPDHVLHTKRIPLILEENANNEQISSALERFGHEYFKYFSKHANPQQKSLDAAPRWVVWSGRGILSFGITAKRAAVVGDIVQHTSRAIQWAESLGGWVALPQKDIFDVEYWELEQAKLKKAGSSPSLQGKVALVTGAAGGIGKACVESLKAQGAAVVAVDINPKVMNLWKGNDILGVVCDVTDRKSVDAAVESAIRTFGGLDIVVANAGLFPSSESVSAINDETWAKTLNVNLTSQMYLFRAATPYLELGIDAAIIVIASKNVPAPGPGAAAYSASKAGLTQLARVAALELAPKGVRVNMLHPHAVMDTAIWTPEILASRAKNYNMTVDQYKKNNLLKVEVRSKDVADLVAALAGPLFSKTTGAQIPIDGGSDRII